MLFVVYTTHQIIHADMVVICDFFKCAHGRLCLSTLIASKCIRVKPHKL